MNKTSRYEVLPCMCKGRYRHLVEGGEGGGGGGGGRVDLLTDSHIYT